MKKTNHKIIALVLGIACTLSPRILMAADAAEAKAAAPNAFNKQELNDLIQENSKVNDFAHQDWNARNPFDTTSIQDFLGVKPTSMTAVDKAGVEIDYKLQGIFLGGEKPSAIMDDVVIGIGDSVKNLKVKEIRDNIVVLVDPQGMEVIVQLRK
jgi:hypothetical protein